MLVVHLQEYKQSAAREMEYLQSKIQALQQQHELMVEEVEERQESIEHHDRVIRNLQSVNSRKYRAEERGDWQTLVQSLNEDRDYLHRDLAEIQEATAEFCKQVCQTGVWGVAVMMVVGRVPGCAAPRMCACACACFAHHLPLSPARAHASPSYPSSKTSFVVPPSSPRVRRKSCRPRSPRPTPKPSSCVSTSARLHQNLLLQSIKRTAPSQELATTQHQIRLGQGLCRRPHRRVR
jgi:hypothetical protein